jgi:DnaJ-domain-containing protein 1
VTDYFALLGQPRRPWLEAEPLRERFLTLSTNVHPDRVHHLGEAERASAQEKYIELNAAYNCLREPRDRLRHLLELELGSLPKEIQAVPSELMDFAMTIGEACRQADGLAGEKAGTTSPLLKVQLFERSQACTEKLQKLHQEILRRRESLVAELRELDRQWAGGSGPSDRIPALQRLGELKHLLSYLDRWTSQIQERVARLSF